MNSLLAHLTPVEGRRGIRLGGSDAAALVGLSPYKTPFDVYQEKMRPANDPDVMTNNRIVWGRRLERVIAEGYAKEQGVEIEWVDRTFAHPDRIWQVMTPDFIVLDTRNYGADAKNVAIDQAYKFGDPGTDDVPDEYKLQCIWYMDISDAPLWAIAALFGGNDLNRYNIQPDPETAGILREAGEKFIHDHLIPEKPPKPGGSAATDAWLKRRFPNSELKGMRMATMEEMELAQRYRVAHEQASVAKRAEDAIEQEMKIAIGEHEGIVLPGARGKVTWRIVEREGYTVGPSKYRRLNVSLDRKRK